MKTGTYIFIVLFGLTLLSAWTVKQANSIRKAEWLIGTWENKTQRGSVFETWSKKHNNELVGMSYMVKEKDTMVFETIKLVQEADVIYYVPIVKSQNNGLPVKFLANIVSENQLVFENKQHDFPQIISYKKITTDSLVAEISGTKNGQVRKMTFPMKKVQ